MKRNRIFCVGAFLGTVLVFLLSRSAPSVQVIDEVKTFLEDSKTQGTPDPSNSFVWPIDLFAENKAPLSNGWKKSGFGTVSRVEDPTGSKFWIMRTVQTLPDPPLNLRVQFPHDTLPALNSRKNHIVFNFRSTTTCALEVKIKVTTPSLVDKIIRYLPENGSNDTTGDTIVVRIGAAYLNGVFQTINRNMETDLKSFYPSYNFQVLNYVYVCGTIDVSGIVAWSRYSYVEGYADSTSIKQGSPIKFRTSLGDSATNQNYYVEIYRAGAIGIGGLELITTLSTHAGVRRPLRQDNKADSVFAYGTDWPVTDSVLGTVTANWKSGVYLAKFIHDSTRNYTWFPFVVREDSAGSTSRILVSVSNLTWQAHNFWGGESFYFPTGKGGWKSFKRPYLLNWFNPEHRTDSANADKFSGSNRDSLGASQFFNYEFPFIKWLEGQGYTAEYTDNVYIHRDYIDQFNPKQLLKNYNSFFSLGHDEYWSREMRRNIEEEFRNKSRPKEVNPDNRKTHNLSFLSGNTCFWMANLNTDSMRIFNDRKDSMSFHIGVKRPNSNLIWYEQELMGERTGDNYQHLGTVDSVLSGKQNHWIFTGTGLAAGNSFGRAIGHPNGISGYRINRLRVGEALPDSTATVETIAQAYHSGASEASQVRYYEYKPPAPSTALSKVFSAGAVQWNWGLDDTGDTAFQRINKNIVEGMTSTFTGKISSNLTLSGDIYLGADVTFDSNVTINAGTKFFVFNNDVERAGFDTKRVDVIINRRFDVNGTAANPVKFVSYRPEASATNNDWRGITIKSGGSIACSDVVIRHAYVGIDTEEFGISGPGTINKARIGRCFMFGINLFGDNFTISSCRVDSVANHSGGNPGEAIFVHGTGVSPYAAVTNDTTIGSNHGINVTQSKGSIVGCRVVGSDSCDSIGSTAIEIVGQGFIGTDSVHIANTSVTGHWNLEIVYNQSQGRAEITNCTFNSSTKCRSPIGILNFSSARLKLRRSVVTDWGYAGVTVPYINLPQIDLGRVPSDSGYNSIYSSQPDSANWKYVLVTDGTPPPGESLRAQANYWGTDRPDTAQNRFGTNVDFRYWLTSPPGPFPRIAIQQERGVLPTRTTLFQNYPNPFNPTTVIRFYLQRRERVRLEVFNILGQQVKTFLRGEEFSPGEYTFFWNGRDDRGNQLSSGLYLYRLKTDSYSETKKMSFVK